MNCDLKTAADILTAENRTLVLCKDGEVYASDERGVLSLLKIAESGRSLDGVSAADKVVGRGAALLYAYLKVRAVYAPVISRPALEILQACGAEVQCEKTVSQIINRRGDGVCPIEQATAGVFDPAAAPAVIRRALARLNSGQTE